MTMPYDPAKSRINQTSFTPDSLHFGKETLEVFPNSNISFKTLSALVITREQNCLLDNLWIASKSHLHTKSII